MRAAHLPAPIDREWEEGRINRYASLASAAHARAEAAEATLDRVDAILRAAESGAVAGLNPAVARVVAAVRGAIAGNERAYVDPRQMCMHGHTGGQGCPEGCD